MAIRHSFDDYNLEYRERVCGWGRISGYNGGGYTLSYLDGGEACAPFVGVAICSPRDTYSRPFGRTLATARMMVLYERYPQAEVVNGRFGVVNLPTIWHDYDGLNALYDAAVLHALDALAEHFDLVETRLVSFGPGGSDD